MAGHHSASSLPIRVPHRALEGFCAKHHIRKLSFFGSVLRGDFRPESDVDVLVEFEPGRVPGFFGFGASSSSSKSSSAARWISTPRPA